MTTTTQRIVRAPVVAPKSRRRTTTPTLQALVADVLRPGETPAAFILAAVRHLHRHRLEDRAVQVALAVLHGAEVADVVRS